MGQVMQCDPPRPRPELEPLDGDDLDARLAQGGVGAGVALVGHHHPGLHRDDVVAVVPLLALGLEVVTPGGDDPQLADAEGLSHGLDEGARALFGHQVVGRGARADAPRAGPLDHRWEEGDEVAVAHGDDGVEVHVAARLGQVDRQDLGGRPRPEQRPGDEEHRLGGGALAHADHDGAVADGLDVAALDVGPPPVLPAAAEPDGEGLGGEHGVERVDRLHDQRLGLAGRLGHGVDGHPVEDPAGRVSLEQEVGKGWQQQRVGIAGVPQPAQLDVDVVAGDAPDQEVGHVGGLGGLDPRLGLLGHPDADLALVEDVGHDPVLGVGLGEGLGEQDLGLEHLDPPLAHHLTEGVVLALGLGHPQHVVEEQVLGVRRREAGVLETGAVDEHLAQGADLRVDAECHVSAPCSKTPCSGRGP